MNCYCCFRPILVGGLLIEFKEKLDAYVHTSCYLINVKPAAWVEPKRPPNAP